MDGTGPGRDGSSGAVPPASERLLHHLIDGVRDGVVLVDPGGRVVRLNRSAERLGARSADAAAGRIGVEALFPSGVWAELDRRRGGRSWPEPIETEWLGAVGDRVPVELSVVPIDQTGTAPWLLLIARERRPRGAGDGPRPPVMLAELAAAAAHELNQPLTSILGYTELLRRGLPDGSPQAATADTVIAEAERLAEIVRKIGRVQRYATKPYVGEARIVDLDRAADDHGRESDSREGREDCDV